MLCRGFARARVPSHGSRHRQKSEYYRRYAPLRAPQNDSGAAIGLRAIVRSAIVKASIREVIATLDDQIAQVERQIRQHFDDHPDLKRQRELLTSIPGIGETTAGSLFREIPHLDRFQSAKAVAAFAGLSPRDRRSGTSIHGRTAALQDRQCSRSQSALHAGDGRFSLQSDSPRFADRLLAAGKHKRLIIGAVMRKLLVLAYGILRSGVAFDANYA